LPAAALHADVCRQQPIEYRSTFAGFKVKDELGEAFVLKSDEEYGHVD
jgi:hypothetical protein